MSLQAIIVYDKVPNDGLYVNGEVTLSINNWFEVADVVLLNGIKYVPYVLSLVNATLLAILAAPEKLVQFKVDIDGT